MGAAIAAALIGVAGTAATAAYSANQQKKAAAGMQSAAGMDTSAMGDVPKPARYDPVDFDQMQIAQVLDNLHAFPNIAALTNQANKYISNDAIRRAQKLIPNYSQGMRQMGANTLDFLSGQLPFEDVLGIVNDRASMSGATGIPGTSGGATLRDLGMSRGEAMKTGSGMLGDMVKMAEMVSPRSSYLNPREMMLSPLDRIRAEMEQRVLVQQSDQNFYNLKAAANPSEVAAMQLRLGNTLYGGQGGGGGTNWGQMAGAAQQLVGGVDSFGKKQGWWGTASTAPATAAAVPNVISTPNMYDYSYDASLGWTPVAQPVAA